MSLADKFGISQGLFDAAKKALEEANEYQKKVQAHMAKKGIKSLNDMTDDQKKKFFNDLDAMHKAKNEEVESVEKEQIDDRSAAKMEELQMGLNSLEAFMQTEDFDQLDELSKTTLGNYIKKRQHDVATMGAITRKHAMDSESAKKENNYTQQRKSNEKADKAFAKGWKHRENISKAVDKLTKEDLEFIESLNKGE